MQKTLSVDDNHIVKISRDDYVGGGSPTWTFWYSTDGGASYTQLADFTDATGIGVNKHTWQLIKNPNGNHGLFFAGRIYEYNGTTWSQVTGITNAVSEPLYSGFVDSRYWVSDASDLKSSTDLQTWTTEYTSASNLKGFATDGTYVHICDNSVPGIKRGNNTTAFATSQTYTGDVVQDVCFLDGPTTTDQLLVARHTASSTTLEIVAVEGTGISAVNLQVATITTVSTLTSSTRVYIEHNGNAFFVTTSSTSDPVWWSENGYIWRESLIPKDCTRFMVGDSGQFTGTEDNFGDITS